MPGGGHACSAPALGCKTQDGPGDGRLGELGLIQGGGAATEDGPGRKSGVLEPASPGDEGGRPRGAAPGLGTSLRSRHSTAEGVPHLVPIPRASLRLCLSLPEGARRWMGSRENHSGMGRWLS